MKQPENHNTEPTSSSSEDTLAQPKVHRSEEDVNMSDSLQESQQPPIISNNQPPVYDQLPTLMEIGEQELDSKFKQMTQVITDNIVEKLGIQLVQLITQATEPEFRKMNQKLCEIEKIKLPPLPNPSKIKELEKQISTLTLEKETLTKTNKVLEIEKKKFSDEKHQIQSHNYSLNQDAKHLNTTIEELKKRVSTLEQEKKQLSTMLAQKQKTEQALEKGIVIDSSGEKKLEEIKKILARYQSDVFNEAGQVIGDKLSEETADYIETFIYFSICKAFVNCSTLKERITLAESMFKPLAQKYIDLADVDGYLEFIEKQVVSIHTVMEKAVNLRMEWFDLSPNYDSSIYELKCTIFMESKEDQTRYFSSIPGVYFGAQLSRKGEAVKVVNKKPNNQTP